MKPTDETMKAIRSTHGLSVAVAAAALILLFAPFGPDYRAALEEAQRLADPKSLEPYEDFARKAITASFANPDFLPHADESTYVGNELVVFIERNLAVCCIAPIAPNDWAVTHALDYEHPPNGAGT